MVVLFGANNYFEKGKATTGFPIYLYRVTAMLAKLGHTPIIVACGSVNKHYMQDGVEIHIVCCNPRKMPLKSMAIGYGALYRSRAVNKKIEEIALARKIDIIQFTSLQGLAVCYHGKIPAVMRLSSYAKVCYATYQTLSRPEVSVMAFLERLAASRCNAVFAPCKNTADVFSADIGRVVSVIETPFVNDVTEYDASVYTELLKGKKYVLFFGTLIVEKGVLVIADTLQRFLEKNEQYYVVICGISTVINGKNAVNIMKDAAAQYKDRFIYIKELAHERLYPVIQNADFVMLPSLAENLSNACIEAMYFERVVIGTDGISFEQLIDDGKSGLLCQPNDAGSLLSKMNEAALMDDEKKKEIGQMAKKRIDKLVPELVVKKLLRYYQYIINGVNK